jgi:hypothetical protein
MHRIRFLWPFPREVPMKKKSLLETIGSLEKELPSVPI